MPTPAPVPPRFAEVFTQLVRRIQPARAIEPGTMQDYYALLKDFQIDAVASAAVVLVKDPRKFFPSVGEWLAAVEQLDVEARILKQRAAPRPPAQTTRQAPPPRSVGQPDATGQWPYDPTETFTADDLAEAAVWRAQKRRVGLRHDPCPHTPMCPSERACLEEMAWYLRHRRELLEQLACG